MPGSVRSGGSKEEFEPGLLCVIGGYSLYIYDFSG